MIISRIFGRGTPHFHHQFNVSLAILEPERRYLLDFNQVGEQGLEKYVVMPYSAYYRFITDFMEFREYEP